MSNTEDRTSINKALLTVGDVNPKLKENKASIKQSLVSRSGRQFESVDHYVSETIVQNFYPKNNNQDDLQLIEKNEDLTEFTFDNNGKLPRISYFFLILLFLLFFLISDFFIIFVKFK